ncbi:hypothetical protein [Streptosporangium sp. NPDC049644]|uniref:hypothetical protein n=1 Tax=Streptosporangium sp. NPDC049644 TaxID=3155507 RepID=UPI003431C224
MAALGPVVNAVALWNSKYLPAAVDQLRAQGVPVKDEGAVRPLPLGHAHLDVLDRYSVSSSTPAGRLVRRTPCRWTKPTTRS